MRIIFAAFFFLTLPLAALQIYQPDFLAQSHLVDAYFILFGLSHFCITGAIYFDRRNRAHFSGTPSRRTIYFAIPAMIFIGFAVYRGFSLARNFPNFDFVFVRAIRILNFYHWSRQSFGMLQILNRRKHDSHSLFGLFGNVESLYFHALFFLMSLTYLLGEKFELLISIAPLCMTSLLFLNCLYRLRSSRTSVFYFILQSFSATLAIYSTPLYIFTSAMHYTEYHVAVFPRLAGVASKPVRFYTSLLLVTAVVAWFLSTAGRQWHPNIGVWLAMFDGLFVAHFFVDAFLWRFRDPFYRASLLPLYFSADSSSRSKARY